MRKVVFVAYENSKDPDQPAKPYGPLRAFSLLYELPLR